MNNDQRGVGETHTNLAIRQAVVAGASGSAGAYNLGVHGWKPGSSLKSIVNLAGTNVDLGTVRETDSGFSTVSGENLAAGNYLVLFIAAHPRGGSLRRK